MPSQSSIEDQWHLLVVEGKTVPARERLSHIYNMLPSTTRCQICKMPFGGLSGRLFRLMGRTRSSINPHLCSTCDTFLHMNPGGVEVRLSMLFADIRGSTSLAEHKSPTEFRRLIDRFYATATNVLAGSNAMIDKLAGDQVSAYYIPGLAGLNHAQVALQAARDLLTAIGYGKPGEPWAPVGIGVHTGEAFFGSVGTRGGIVDVTALGDPVNVTARLASSAGPGEILVSKETYSEAELDLGELEQRDLELKGRSQPVSVYVIQV